MNSCIIEVTHALTSRCCVAIAGSSAFGEVNLCLGAQNRSASEVPRWAASPVLVRTRIIYELESELGFCVPLFDPDDTLDKRAARGSVALLLSWVLVLSGAEPPPW